jgi:hypothetical protein
MKNGVFWGVCRVALVKTDVSKELSASFIRVYQVYQVLDICKICRLLVTASVVPSSPILVTLMK